MKKTDQSFETAASRRRNKAGQARSKSEMSRPQARQTTIQKILVPVDFSPASLHALDYAADRAREWRAELILLHVLEPMLAESRFSAPRLSTLKAEARRVKQRLLLLARKRVAAGIPVKPWLLNGEAGELILNAASRTECDLIIMGSAGRKGVRRLLLGSVAERVVREADCPVTIVRAPRPRKAQPMRAGLGAGFGERAAVVLIGAPGSGKTTLARAISEQTPISIIEVGNLLKHEVQQRTALGRAMQPFTSTGNLVPLAHVTKTISKALRSAREEVVLFDGIPRATSQILPFLEMLAEHGLELRAVIILTLDLQTALDRLTGRRICKQCGALYNVAERCAGKIKNCERCGGELVQRQDDREEIVRERFERFAHETVPVIEFFKKEFSALTWEQSATSPMKQRIERVWGKLEAAIH